MATLGMSIKRGLVFAVLSVLTPTVFEGVDHAAAEEGERSFGAVATASGMSVQYGIPGFLVVEKYIDGGGPVSQALFNSDQTPNAFASLPYPGSTALAYPGVVAIFTGTAPPGYPFYVSANYPVAPEQKLSDPSGTYSLIAKADGSTSTGHARLSAPSEQSVSGTVSSSSVEVTGGVVVARATSEAKGISIGPLTVGLVTSESATTYTRGAAAPTTETSLSVEGGRVGDLTFSFAKGGLKVANMGLPVPIDQGSAALNEALKPSGLSLHFQEVAPLPGGATAAAFEIISVADVPGAGRGTLRIGFGGATSFISLGVDPSAPVDAAAPDDGAATVDNSSKDAESQAPVPASSPAPRSTAPDAERTWSPARGLVTAPKAASGPPHIRDPLVDNVVAVPPEAASVPDEARDELPENRLAQPVALSQPDEPAQHLADLAGLLAVGTTAGLGMVVLWRITKLKQQWPPY